MKKFIFLPCVILFLLGCSENEGPLKLKESFVIAGLKDNLNSQEISPLYISCERQDYDNGTYHGVFYDELDSIDIDNDNIYDFEFEQYFITSTPNVCDTNVLDACDTFGEELRKIRAINGFQIAYNSYDDIFCAKTPKNFQLNDTINTHESWISGVASSCAGQLHWYEIALNGYWGIRYTNSDTLYGWIKINIAGDHITIEEYYLED